MLNNKKILVLFFILFSTFSYSATFKSETIVNAVKQNNFDMVRQSLRKGISPNSQDSMGNPILLTAIGMGYSDISSLLIKNRANVNVAYNMGMNSLMLAINKGMEDVQNS